MPRSIGRRGSDPMTAVLPQVRLGVARDQAFCFYYPENFTYLTQFGAELVPFSPLHDPVLPDDLDGLYLGGGYPEVFAEELSANAGMLNSIQEMAVAGSAHLCRVRRFNVSEPGAYHLAGERTPMAGVLPLEVRMLPRLKALGYRQITLTGGLFVRARPDPRPGGMNSIIRKSLPRYRPVESLSAGRPPGRGPRIGRVLPLSDSGQLRAPAFRQ